jgi:hypothetical protein
MGIEQPFVAREYSIQTGGMSMCDQHVGLYTIAVSKKTWYILPTS